MDDAFAHQLFGVPADSILPRFEPLYSDFPHHGLLGLPLKALPLAAAHACSRRNSRVLAAACMMGAVMGRGLLQIPRLLVCVAAVVNETLLTLVGLAIVYSTIALLGAGQATFRANTALFGRDHERAHQLLDSWVSMVDPLSSVIMLDAVFQ